MNIQKDSFEDLIPSICLFSCKFVLVRKETSSEWILLLWLLSFSIFISISCFFIFKSSNFKKQKLQNKFNFFSYLPLSSVLLFYSSDYLLFLEYLASQFLYDQIFWIHWQCWIPKVSGVHDYLTRGCHAWNYESTKLKQNCTNIAPHFLRFYSHIDIWHPKWKTTTTEEYL